MKIRVSLFIDSGMFCVVFWWVKINFFVIDRDNLMEKFFLKEVYMNMVIV